MKSSENSVIIETARALRRKCTKGESVLWEKLRNKKMNCPAESYGVSEE